MKKFYSYLFIIVIFILITFTPYVMHPTTPVSASSLSAKKAVSPPNVLPIQATKPTALWLAPGLPPTLRDDALSWGIPLTQNQQDATVTIESADPGPGALHVSTWTYALVAPFPTILDDISSYDLRNFWMGTSEGPFNGVPLLMDASTLAAFSAVWGEPASGVVKIVPAADLLETAWGDMPSWAIIPFEELQTKWKVLTVDGASPIQKHFNQISYPLTLMFRLRSEGPVQHELIKSNYDPNKLTTVIMTGVTALVRATAREMELKGVLTPGRDVRNVFRDADILHISNEIPFYPGCPYPNPKRGKLVFCSDPRYMSLLTDVGVDIVELSGDHFGDYGPEATRETVQMYQDMGIAYYAGGMDLNDARKPYIIENNGNKIAFIGCNGKGQSYALAFATDTKPGALPCDYQYMSSKITELHEKGYVVIDTFQWHESNAYSPIPDKFQYIEFRLMADSGADIVSGSQAHFPQIMEFHNNKFIHFGLGNLFFDQMGDVPTVPGIRREFADEYVIYDNKNISIELLTNMLEDYSRPRPMTPQERADFLLDYFVRSGWLKETPKPTPQPTMTLTPLALPPLSSQNSGSASVTPTPTPK